MQIKPNKRGFTLTKEDFRFDTFTAGGHGGQNVQKTATAVRCVHEPSGAEGVARDQRSQPQNRKLAFERCTSSPRFRVWCAEKLEQIEAGRSTEEWVEEQMKPENLGFERKVGDRWVQWDGKAES